MSERPNSQNPDRVEDAAMIDGVMPLTIVRRRARRTLMRFSALYAGVGGSLALGLYYYRVVAPDENIYVLFLFMTVIAAIVAFVHGIDGVRGYRRQVNASRRLDKEVELETALVRKQAAVAEHERARAEDASALGRSIGGVVVFLPLTIAGALYVFDSMETHPDPGIARVVFTGLLGLAPVLGLLGSFDALVEHLNARDRVAALRQDRDALLAARAERRADAVKGALTRHEDASERGGLSEVRAGELELSEDERE